jgi:molecular chaperone DnaK (HSP70)
LLPDQDCSLTMTRKDLETKAESLLSKLSQLIRDTLQASGLAPDAVAGVEVVGGGARVPCVLECIKHASGQTQTRHTLDSSAAVAFGAASLGKLLAIEGEKGPTEADAQADSDPNNADGAVGMDNAFVEVCKDGGMSDEELAGAVERERGMRETDRAQREAHDARNRLEEWVYGMREALGGRSGHLLDRNVVERKSAWCARTAWNPSVP